MKYIPKIFGVSVCFYVFVLGYSSSFSFSQFLFTLSLSLLTGFAVGMYLNGISILIRSFANNDFLSRIDGELLIVVGIVFFVPYLFIYHLSPHLSNNLSYYESKGAAVVLTISCIMILFPCTEFISQMLSKNKYFKKV
jgi:hypothetical protein